MTAICVLLALSALQLDPAPRQIEVENRRFFQLRAQTPVVVADSITPAEQEGIAALFRALGNELPIVPASRFRTSGIAIYVGSQQSNTALDTGALRNKIGKPEKLGPEGYRLRIWDEGAAVAGADLAGTLHGLRTLIQIAAASRGTWPCVDISDSPSLVQRGVHVRIAPDIPELDTLAQLHCNLLLIEHPDLEFLDGPRVARWQRIFQEARNRGIEPVPVFRILGGAEDLVARAPNAAEGRTTAEPHTLPGFRPVALAYPGTIVSLTCAPQVKVSTIACRAGRDYLLVPPAPDAAGIWSLRGVPCSGIPDGATITVRYSHAPAASSALCPRAKETESVVKLALEALIKALNPKYIHLGPGTVARLNQDMRCLDTPASDAALVAEALELESRIAREIDSDIGLLCWDRAGFPDGTPLNFAPTARNIRVIPLLDAPPAPPGRGESPPEQRLAALEASTAGAYALASRFAAGKNNGIILLATSPGVPAVRQGLSAAWTGGAPKRAWPEGLNAFFGVELWEPDYAARLDALVRYLDGQTRLGVPPDKVFRNFEATYKILRRSLGDEMELDATRSLLDNLCTYLALETEFHTKPGTSVFSSLASLVKKQAKLAPGFGEDRETRILETMQQQGLFVPASILFGAALDYYRPIVLPPGYRPLPIPASPAYTDQEHKTQADFDLRGLMVPVYRIDFETVAANRVAVAASDDGVRYETLQEWTPEQPSGVRGPVLPNNPPAHPWLRVTAESSQPAAVLRELRLLGAKGPVTLRCPQSVDPRTQLTAPEWANGATARGFVLEDDSSFAEAPSFARVCRNRSALYIAIEAREPRMHALVAEYTTRDAPLWEQEAVEVRIAPPGALPCRLLVNPQGAQYDSQRGDTGWDGEWTAEVRNGAESWTALFEIPFDTLGATPKPGETWQVNFARHRYNVIKEHSAWAISDGPAPAYGALRFE